jgi:succinate dehydrogenase hydrophobic anchor subunit
MLAFRSFLVGKCYHQNRSCLTDLDLATFLTIFYYAVRYKSQYGMPYIIKTVLEDTTIYSFVMALCHLVLVLFVILAKVMVFPFPNVRV